LFLEIRGTYPQDAPRFMSIQGIAYDEFGGILDTYFLGGVEMFITETTYPITFTVGGLIPAYVNIVIEFSASDAGSDLGARYINLMSLKFV